MFIIFIMYLRLAVKYLKLLQRKARAQHSTLTTKAPPVLFTIILEVFESGHISLVLHNDAEQLADGDSLGAGRDQDLGQVALLRSLKAHGGLVCLNLTEQITC